MKISKETLLAIVISAGILLGWTPFCKMMGWIPDKPAPVRIEKTQTAEKAVPENPAPAPVAPQAEITPAPVAVKTVAPAAKNKALPCVKLQNDLLEIAVSPDSGSIEAITLKKYQTSDRKGNIVVSPALSDPGRGALALFPEKSAWTFLETVQNQLQDGKFLLVRKMRDASGNEFLLTQSWELRPGKYETLYTASLRNVSANAMNFSDLVVFGGELLPWAKISGDKTRIASHRMSYMLINGAYEDIDADKKHSKFMLDEPAVVDWCAVSNKYFCSILDAENPFTLFQSQVMDGKTPMISAGARLDAFTLSPGAEKSFSFRLYSGPKIPAELNSFHPSTDKVLHLAWGPLNYLAKLLLWILIQLNDVFHSYGISIILLTLIVRLIFYPVTAKANASMKKMQVVQPQLKELREKYKDNPQLMNAKMMELYRREKVNPLGGCLPILLQIPIFFALYQMLDSAILLRQTSFLWCKDLAQADTVCTIPLYFFDLPLNPLVIAMTVLMLIQQRLTPAVGDPAQRKMMMFMPVVMLLFLYDLPSGLTLYWTVSNAFSILQMILQNRTRTAVTASAGK
ncbi:MAG: membrane protein insertase YidC [Victivallaceae bacterium]|nr:membrane protein insertase YidC [Victivallaceae bacterium]